MDQELRDQKQNNKVLQEVIKQLQLERTELFNRIHKLEKEIETLKENEDIRKYQQEEILEENIELKEKLVNKIMQIEVFKKKEIEEQLNKSLIENGKDIEQETEDNDFEVENINDNIEDNMETDEVNQEVVKSNENMDKNIKENTVIERENDSEIKDLEVMETSTEPIREILVEKLEEKNKKRKREDNNEDNNEKQKKRQKRNEDDEWINDVIRRLLKPVKETIESQETYSNNIRKGIVESYRRMEETENIYNRISKEVIKSYYEFTEMVYKETINRQGKGEREIQTEIINEIMKGFGWDKLEEKELKKKRDRICKKKSRANRIFNLFKQIGKDKMENIEPGMTHFLLNLDKKDVEYIEKKLLELKI
jgi:hypothetical protein